MMPALPFSLRLAIVLVAPFLAAVPLHAQERPNLVLFLVDDMGWCDTSVVFPPEPGPRHRLLRTPAMERLAREGLVFTQGYASSPVCSPTRTAILTGRNPARTGITNWIPGRGNHGPEDHRLLVSPWRRDGLGPGDRTLPRLLRELGYQTAHVGKAHFAREGTPGADPRLLGFDHVVAGNHLGGPGSHLPPYGAGGRHAVPDLEEHAEAGRFLTDALTEEALDLVRGMEAEGRPWFLELSHYALHAPIEADPARIEAWKGKLGSPALDAYASMIQGVDDSLGRLLDLLDELGAAERTLVVFTSDNGGLTAHSGPPTSNAPLRSGKGSWAEGGIRVPWIVRWTGVVSAGRRTDVPVISEDLFPTLLRAAGASVSAPWFRDLDGVDLGPVLRGAESLERPLPLVWHYPHYWGWPALRRADPAIAPFSALRLGDWKIVWLYEEERALLFDLAADLGETRDLAAERPELRDRLLRALHDRLAPLRVQTPRSRENGLNLGLPRVRGE